MTKSFHDLLRPELFLNISGCGELLVKECDSCAILKKLRIQRVPNGSVAFKLDYSPSSKSKMKLRNLWGQLSCLISSSHAKANKRCDFVIVSPGESSSKIILGEMKSRKLKRADCSAQLRNSELYVNYLLSLLSEYHAQAITPEYKKVVFFVVLPTQARALTQQRHKQKLSEHDGVTYVPVIVAGAGRKNSQASVPYSRFT